MNAGVLAAGLGLFYLAAIGFMQRSAPRREYLWSLWREADAHDLAKETDEHR